MPQYDSDHTGEQVDEAVRLTLGNKNKGSNVLPVYLNAYGEAVPVNKDTTPTENSTNIVESGGVFTQLSTKLPFTDVNTTGTITTSDTTVPSVLTVEEYVESLAAPKQDFIYPGTDIIKEGNKLSVDTRSDLVTTGKIDNKWNHFTPELETGYDKDLVDEMFNAKHSTFDRSKFSIEPVSSPAVSITDSGLASGFTTTSYIYKDLNISTGSKIDLFIKSNLQTSASDRALFSLMSGSTCLVEARVESDGQSVDWVTASGADTREVTTLTYNYIGEVLTKISYQSGVLNVYAGTNISDLVLVGSISGIYDLAVDKLKIGVTYGNTLPLTEGNIDLKYVDVRSNNIPVFSGNKEGMDILKTKTGQAIGEQPLPTIDNEGIAHFQRNGVEIEMIGINNFTLSNTDNFKVSYSFVCPEFNPTATSGYNTAWTIGSRDVGIQLIFHPGGLAGFFLYRVGGSDFLVYDKANVYHPGEVYTIITERIGSKIYTTTINKTRNYTFALNTKDIGSRSISVTNGSFYYRSVYSPIDVDLSVCKLYVNDELVYQPLLYIPYTFAKDGNKIVDLFYRDRVEDEFTQVGYTPYSILTTNLTPNYIWSGDPSVSDDFILSGLSTSKRVRTTYQPGIVSDFEIVLDATTGNEVPTNRGKGGVLLGQWGSNHHTPQVELDLGGGTSWLGLSTDGTSWMNFSFVYPFKLNTKYNFRLKLKNGVVMLFINNNAVITGPISGGVYFNDYLFIGGDQTQYWWNGSIDLKTFKIYVNGHLAYSAVNPRNYELATIKETNLISTYSNGANQARKFANQFIKMQGTCTADTAVTFPNSAAFQDTNYFLSVPYSAKSTTGFTPTVDGDYIAEGYTSI